ncbi:hypothetical protein K491DRAFT_719901 [Lophiostoma macrostomum CBS 122681]|uniref:BTB domain-containing protein n=1 Tax=Lophiostoma macrostomum CBS 122681 TaxID=1314788 RepID=A0A6A6SWH6_9PLEO|nr:hypothetical protein K491DRAFT_719901 [Lophiostoma macrostomum CBS 122681]
MAADEEDEKETRRVNLWQSEGQVGIPSGSSEQSSPKRALAAKTPIIIIVVMDNQEYYVHQCLLMSTSRYFAAALERDFAEAQTKRNELPIVDADTLGVRCSTIAGPES